MNNRLDSIISEQKPPNHNIALASKHERILKATFEDLIAFGKIFLHGDFGKSATPPFHYEIAEELTSDSTKPCAIVIARGHAKTTLIKASIIRDFCFRHKAAEWGLDEPKRSLFYGWVSSNQKKSTNNVAYVRLHLKRNKLIHFYFGEQMARFEKDNQEDITTGYGDRLLSSSNLTSMRGDTLATIEHGAVRYTRVFIDDAENEENTRTQNSREKIVDNIMNGIYPAIEKNTPGATLFLIETPVHWDAFAQRILDSWAKVKSKGQEAIDDFTWRVIAYAATQPEMPGGVLWDSYMPRKKLDEIRKIYEQSPRGVSGYYQEYELEVQSRENSLFNRDHLRFWEGRYERKQGINYIVINDEYVPVNTFIGCDPATDIDNKMSDFSVIMVIAVDAANNTYVLEYERHRNIPTLALRNENGEIEGKPGVVDLIVQLYDKYNCSAGTVEDVAMNRSIFQDLNRVRKEKNRFDISIIPEKPGGREKLNRIYTGLNNRFSARAMFLREHHYDLIDEILKFGPKMAHDDTIEALYYACRYAYPYKGATIDKTTGELSENKKRTARSWVVS